MIVVERGFLIAGADAKSLALLLRNAENRQSRSANSHASSRLIALPSASRTPTNTRSHRARSRQEPKIQLLLGAFNSLPYTSGDGDVPATSGDRCEPGHAIRLCTPE